MNSDNKASEKDNFFGSMAALYLLLFFTIILIFNDLSKPGLPSDDDCAKAQRGWEMLQSRDFLTPHLAGRPNFDHPPLYVGFIALSTAVFGKTEFAARFPSALCALLVIWLVYEIGRIMRNRVVGWWAGFFLLTSYIFLKVSRRVQADIPFMSFATLAMMFFIRAVKKEQERKAKNGRAALPWAGFILLGLFSGLAGLIKSVFVVFPIGLPFLYLISDKKLLKRLFLPYLVAFLIALVVCGWWYLYEYLKYDEVFINDFVLKFLKHHSAGGSGMGKYGVFGYLYEFNRHFLPWLPLLYLTIWWGGETKKIRRDGYIRLLVIYAVCPYLILSFFGDKAVRYIIFTFAPIALFMAAVSAVKIKQEGLARLGGLSVIILFLLSAYVVVRPVDYENITNYDYIQLKELVEKGKVSFEKTAVYHYGIHYKKNYRALLYYTGYELAGILPSETDVSALTEKNSSFYLLIDKADTNGIYLVKFTTVADLENKLLLYYFR